MKKRADTTRKSKKRLLWKIPLIVLSMIFIIVGIYVAYVFLTYERIEDNLVLEVEGDADETATAGKEYTIVSYNIGFGAYTADYTFFMDGGKESRARSKDSVIGCVDGSAQTALSFKPDFAIFQEVDTDSTRSFHVNEVEQIIDLFGEAGKYDSVFALNYHSAYLMYPVLEPHGASNAGLLTLSNVDISSGLRRSFPIAKGIKKILDLDRCYSISRIPADNGKELILINVHTSAYGTDASQGNAQMEMLFEDMKKEYDKGNYVICGGDFNHDFTGNSKEYFNPGFTDDYAWCQPFPDSDLPEGFTRCMDYADELIPSARNADIPYSEDSFVVILDGFVISDNIECDHVQIIDTGFKYSDHNPVVMKFRLKP